MKAAAGPAPSLPEILAVREDRSRHPRRSGGRPAPSDVLSVYLDGGPRYRLGARTYEFAPPVGILLPEGILDEDLQEGRVDGIFAVFRGRGLVRPGQDPPGSGVRLSPGGGGNTAPCLKELSGDDARRLAGTIAELGAVGGGGPLPRLKRTSLLFRALCEYCAAPARGGPEGVHRAAAQLRGLIDELAFENIPMARIYDRLDVSPAHLATLFTAAYGLAPVAYRRQLRLRRARELLVSSQMNVSEAAYAVGFTDPLYFSRVFHRAYNATPSELIRNFSGRRK